MRFLHTADWHIGKKLHGYDLLKNQAAAMAEILAIAKEEAVDAIVIAGDLYDRSVPGIESIELLNQQFIQMNLEAGLPILAVSGNHDSATRLATGAPWYKQQQFHMHTTLEEALVPVVLSGVQFYLLPYFEPIAARLYFEDETIKTIGQAVARVVQEMEKTFDQTMKQVLVSHFFVAGSSRTESETSVEVGGLDAVTRDIFSAFDYVALGHLHSKDALKGGHVRYSGSLLKYSLSEIDDEKGVWLVDSQTMDPTFIALHPMQDIRHYEASFAQLTDPTVYQKLDREAFWHFELTDRAVIPNMMNQLRAIYPYVLTVERKNGHQVVKQATKKRAQVQAPAVVLTDFFKEVTGEELTEQQRTWLETGLTLALDTEKRED